MLLQVPEATARFAQLLQDAAQMLPGYRAVAAVLAAEGVPQLLLSCGQEAVTAGMVRPAAAAALQVIQSLPSWLNGNLT